jgi:hypothetical protein
VRATSWLNLNAFGLAGADAMFGGIAGQGSANGAFIDLPHPDQNIKGGAIAGAAQGSWLDIMVLAGTGLYGDVEVDAGAMLCLVSLKLVHIMQHISLRVEKLKSLQDMDNARYRCS